ncbi:hypothetical protein Tco_0554742 [Tanacetum coccineum]
MKILIFLFLSFYLIHASSNHAINQSKLYANPTLSAFGFSGGHRSVAGGAHGVSGGAHAGEVGGAHASGAHAGTEEGVSEGAHVIPAGGHQSTHRGGSSSLYMASIHQLVLTTFGLVVLLCFA